MKTATLDKGVVLLFAIACGLAVGNVYYAQPLLDAMADAFGLSPGSIGIVMTLTQVGYGLGLLLLVPLGDLLNRRRLIVTQTLLSAAALLMIALASNSAWLLIGVTLTGLLAVVTQVLVAYAATLAVPAQRGKVVGVITSGIVVGILLARTVAGGMADLAGWRSIYLLSAGLTLVMAALLFRVLPKDEDARPSTRYVALIASVFSLFREEPVLRQRAILALLTFASAMVLWTPMVLPLAAPPLSLSHSEIGMFGLAGAAGALAAARAGHLADRGWGQWVSGLSLLLMLGSWLPIALTHLSLWALLLGVITLDLGLQAVHVTSQSMIYSVRPEAQSRLTAGYMLFYSIGSALGSIASTTMYACAGWPGVCWLGAAINMVALLYWWRTLATPKRGEAACALATSD
ncbi:MULTISPECIES: MFS transporter [unclassified Pseudomonas]|uniref:MFS transporter n=1 Tax=unclassified Pseudomonas TaxID=196821 RepID=UPI000A1F16AF|nr:MULTISPECIES: MFS transporter [unclassified Pseudomonas]